MSDGPFVRSAARSGAIAGIVVLYVALVGMVERVDALAIFGTVVLSWLLILGPPALAAYLSLRPKVLAGQTVEPDRVSMIVAGVVAGVVTTAPVVAFVGLVNWLGLDTVRSVLRSVSPVLMTILAFHTDTVRGTVTLCVLIVVAGLVGAAVHIVPSEWRRPIANGLSAVLLLGLLQRSVPTSLDQINVQRDWLYSRVTLGLTDLGAILAFVVTAGATFALRGRGIVRRPRTPHPGDDEEGHPLEGRLGRRRTVALIG